MCVACMFGSIFLLFWNRLLDWNKLKFMQDEATIFTFSISLGFSIHVNWWSSKCIFPQLFALIMFAYLLLPLRHAVKAWFFLIVSINHCVKSVHIRSFPVHIFPHSVWIRRDIKYVSVFSTNAEKCRPEKSQIRTLFSQWIVLTLQVGRGY